MRGLPRDAEQAAPDGRHLGPYIAVRRHLVPVKRRDQRVDPDGVSRVIRALGVSGIPARLIAPTTAGIRLITQWHSVSVMTERKPAGMSFTSWIDQQIEEAAERGAFDDLPGAGK